MENVMTSTYRVIEADVSFQDLMDEGRLFEAEIVRRGGRLVKFEIDEPDCLTTMLMEVKDD